MKYDIVELAYQIIDMHKEILFLRQEVDHYKKLHEINCESLDRSHKHTMEMTGIILNAVIDPESVINKGIEAKIREQIEV